METLVLGWASGQSWFGLACTIIACANAVTLTLKDEYAESIPIIGKIWPILNWLSLNVANNKNEKA
jgi:hypothetical protein